MTRQIKVIPKPLIDWSWFEKNCRDCAYAEWIRIRGNSHFQHSVNCSFFLGKKLSWRKNYEKFYPVPCSNYRLKGSPGGFCKLAIHRWGLKEEIVVKKIFVPGKRIVEKNLLGQATGQTNLDQQKLLKKNWLTILL